jgi:hypothetical protein
MTPPRNAIAETTIIYISMDSFNGLFTSLGRK